MKATFDADFGTFRREVESAIATLKGFEGEAENVAEMLSKMSNRFTGIQVIQQATLMAKAVENVGGTARLTARELEQVGNVARDAAFKLQAWGQEVPENIAALSKFARPAAADLRQLGQEAGGVSGAMIAMGNALGTVATLASQKVVQLITQTLAQAQALRAMSNETGIAVQEVQVLGEMFRESGVTGEQMGKAIDALARRVSGDKGSASGAFHELGISMEELKSKTPLDLFKTAVGLLDNMTDRARAATIAGDLFGERLGAAVLKVAHNFEDMHKSAAAATAVMTEDQVAKVARMADSWERFKTAVTVETAEIMARIADAHRDFNDALDKGVPLWKVFLADTADKLLKDLPVLRQYATVLHDLAAAARVGALPPMGMAPSHGAPTMMPSHGGPLTEDQEAEIALQKILADRDKELTESQRHRLEVLYDQNILTAENARAVKVTVDQMEKFRHEQDQIIAGQVRLSNELREYGTIQTEITKRYSAAQDEINKKTETQLHLRADLVGVLVKENAAALAALQARALGPGVGDADPAMAAIRKRNEALREIERQQEAQDERNAAIRQRNFEKGQRIFAGEQGVPGMEVEDNRIIDRSLEITKIWADFDDEMKGIADQARRVAGGFDQIGAAAARAGKQINDAFNVPLAERFSDITPWSDLVPRAIQVRPIAPRLRSGQTSADLAGSPINITVNGVIDTASHGALRAAFSDILRPIKQWQTA